MQRHKIGCPQIHQELCDIYGLTDSLPKNTAMSNNVLPPAKDVFGEGIVWYDKEKHGEYMKELLSLNPTCEVDDSAVLYDDYCNKFYSIPLGESTFLHIYAKDYFDIVSEYRQETMDTHKYNQEIVRIDLESQGTTSLTSSFSGEWNKPWYVRRRNYRFYPNDYKNEKD